MTERGGRGPAPGWWRASDGNWYPPHLHPGEVVPQDTLPPTHQHPDVTAPAEPVWSSEPSAPPAGARPAGTPPTAPLPTSPLPGSPPGFGYGPPQSGPGAVAADPSTSRKVGTGCLLGCLVVVVALIAAGIAGTVFVLRTADRFVDEVEDTTGVEGLPLDPTEIDEWVDDNGRPADMTCPDAAAVSALLPAPVEPTGSLDELGGCAYRSASGPGGTTVTVVGVPRLAGSALLGAVRDRAAAAGSTLHEVGVGTDGVAFGTDTHAVAAATGLTATVEVDILTATPTAGLEQSAVGVLTLVLEQDAR